MFQMTEIARLSFYEFGVLARRFYTVLEFEVFFVQLFFSLYKIGVDWNIYVVAGGRERKKMVVLVGFGHEEKKGGRGSENPLIKNTPFW